MAIRQIAEAAGVPLRLALFGDGSPGRVFALWETLPADATSDELLAASKLYAKLADSYREPMMKGYEKAEAQMKKDPAKVPAKVAAVARTFTLIYGLDQIAACLRNRTGGAYSFRVEMETPVPRSEEDTVRWFGGQGMARFQSFAGNHPKIADVIRALPVPDDHVPETFHKVAKLGRDNKSRW